MTLKVLIVDDDHQARGALKRLTEKHGATAIEAGDGKAGLEAALLERPDAIISDGLMPGMDGFQFLQAVRKDPALRAVPFILYSAVYTSDEERNLAASLGADALVEKSSDLEELWRKLLLAIEARHGGGAPEFAALRPEKDAEDLRSYGRFVAAKLETKVRELEAVIADHERTKAERARIETLLRVASDEWRTTFDAMNDAIALLDRDGRILRCNKAMATLADKPFAELVGRHCWEAVLDASGPGNRCPFALTKKSKKRETTSLRIGARWFEATADPYFGATGDLLGAVQVLEDVTERRRNEETIGKIAQQQQAILNNIPHMAWLKDQESRFLAVNEPFGRACGLKPEEVTGKTDLLLWPRELAERYREDDREVMLSGKRKMVEEPLTDVDGHTIWIETIKTPIHDEKGDVIGTTGIAGDITGRKRAQEAIDQQKHFTESLIQGSAVATFVLDAAHGVVSWNRACEELTGVKASEIVGTHSPWKAFYDHERPVLADLVLDSSVDELQGLYPTTSRSVLTPDGLHAERWLPHLNGRDRYIVFDAAPVRDGAGNVTAAIETLLDFTAQKSMQDEIELARIEWEETFDTITDMVTVHDMKFHVVRANKAAQKILGLPLLGSGEAHCYEYFHGTTCPPESCASCQSLVTEEPSTTEVFEPHLGLHLEVRAIPRRDANGRIAGLIHVVRDITERKANEEALAAHSRELTALNTASNSLMLITSVRGIYQEICDIVFSVFRLKMVWLGVIGEDGHDVMPVAYCGDDDGFLSSIRVTWDDSPLGKGPTGMAIKERRTFAATIDDASIAPWKDKAQLRGYRAVLSAPLVDARNECVGALTFYSDKGDYFTPDRVSLCQVFANQAAIAIENAKLVEGLEDKVLERTRQMEDANVELQTLNRELQLRREEADTASSSKTDFLANMSHELRTPLNAIMGFSDIMLMGLAGPVSDKQKEFLGDISTSGQHLLSLINDILDLSKVEAGRVELELSELSTKELIAGSLMMFKEKSLKHAIRVETSVDEALPDITADRRKVKQTLVNLLSNAFKFTPDGGSVRVAARRVQAPEESADFIELSVADTGIGISPEHQQKLFKPFQQIETSLTRKYAGTGLGLSLCRSFVELHGGRIWVESEEGKGSTFFFTIPVHTAPRRTP